MINEFSRPISVLLHMLLVVSALLCPRTVAAGGDDIVDRELAARLQELGFTGNIEATLEKRVNRAVNPARDNQKKGQEKKGRGSRLPRKERPRLASQKPKRS